MFMDMTVIGDMSSYFHLSFQSDIQLCLHGYPFKLVIIYLSTVKDGGGKRFIISVHSHSCDSLVSVCVYLMCFFFSSSARKEGSVKHPAPKDCTYLHTTLRLNSHSHVHHMKYTLHALVLMLYPLYAVHLCRETSEFILRDTNKTWQVCVWASVFLCNHSMTDFYFLLIKQEAFGCVNSLAAPFCCLFQALFLFNQWTEQYGGFFTWLCAEYPEVVHYVLKTCLTFSSSCFFFLFVSFLLVPPKPTRLLALWQDKPPQQIPPAPCRPLPIPPPKPKTLTSKLQKHPAKSVCLLIQKFENSR